MFSLGKKTVIITGGTSGIGKAISLLFARCGAHVVIFDIDEKTSGKVVDEIITEGGIARFIVLNVSIQHQVHNAVMEVITRVRNRKFSKNFPGHNLSAGWEHLMKWPIRHYISAAMKQDS